jgi:hypothetical protein
MALSGPESVQRVEALARVIAELQAVMTAVEVAASIPPRKVVFRKSAFSLETRGAATKDDAAALNRECGDLAISEICRVRLVCGGSLAAARRAGVEVVGCRDPSRLANARAYMAAQQRNRASKARAAAAAASAAGARTSTAGAGAGAGAGASAGVGAGAGTGTGAGVGGNSGSARAGARAAAGVGAGAGAGAGTGASSDTGDRGRPEAGGQPTGKRRERSQSAAPRAQAKQRTGADSGEGDGLVEGDEAGQRSDGDSGEWEGSGEEDEEGHSDEMQDVSDDEETVSGEDSEDAKNRIFRNGHRQSLRVRYARAIMRGRR